MDKNVDVVATSDDFRVFVGDRELFGLYQMEILDNNEGEILVRLVINPKSLNFIKGQTQ